jgi:hypothetical protein
MPSWCAPARRTDVDVAFGAQVLVATNDSRLRVYYTHTYTLACKYRGYANTSAAIRACYSCVQSCVPPLTSPPAFAYIRTRVHGEASDDAKFILAGSEDGRAYLWRAEAGLFRDRNHAHEAWAEGAYPVCARIWATRTPICGRPV